MRLLAIVCISACVTGRSMVVQGAGMPSREAGMLDRELIVLMDDDGR